MKRKGPGDKGAFTCCRPLFTLTTEFLWSAFKQYQFIENVRHKSRYHCHQLLYNLCVYKKNEKLTSFSLMHFSSLEEACNKSLTKWRRRTFYSKPQLLSSVPEKEERQHGLVDISFFSSIIKAAGRLDTLDALRWIWGKEKLTSEWVSEDCYILYQFATFCSKFVLSLILIRLCFKTKGRETHCLCNGNGKALWIIFVGKRGFISSLVLHWGIEDLGALKLKMLSINRASGSVKRAMPK